MEAYRTAAFARMLWLLSGLTALVGLLAVVR